MTQSSNAWPKANLHSVSTTAAFGCSRTCCKASIAACCILFFQAWHITDLTQRLANPSSFVRQAANSCSYNVDICGPCSCSTSVLLRPCASCSNSRHLSWAHLKGCESGDIWGDSCGYLRWSNFGNRWCCDRKFKHTASYSWTGLKVRRYTQ
jgi:hypothetical protein